MSDRAYIILSVLMMLACCAPCGIIALIYAIFAQLADDKGDIPLAMKHRETSKLFLVIGFWAATAILAVWFVFIRAVIRH